MNISILNGRAIGTLAFFTLVFLVSSRIGTAYAVNTPSPPEGTHEFADYNVHYSTFNSLFVPADIAKVHGLVRAKDQTFINISVQKKADAQSVMADISGTAKNLMQQVKAIKFKTINEPDAVYYIGTLRHTNEEILHLDLAITPQGESAPLEFRLTRKLYTEN